ncbi:MAG: DEAD/DEAH box helicase [Bacteriovoracaceae bacterium]|nr:DEAD/DEAH box helicase [Bacteriovoracaceae bacterium]
MQNFASFGLPSPVLRSLEQLSFSQPTAIQSEVIPLVLQGKDILGSAQTGTGKTGAFGIPIVAKILEDPKGIALIITPTRELAAQVLKQMIDFIGDQKAILRTALLIGGDSIHKQLQQLQKRPRIIVGTPGRINDHLLKRSLRLDDTRFLVLDETDRMLDMGFTPQIESIVEKTPASRQTLMFSATIPKNIVSISNRYLKSPVRIAIGEESKPAERLTQELFYVKEADKGTHLNSELQKREGSIIVFVKTKIGAERLAKKLRQDDLSANAVHGDLPYKKREQAIQAFRASKYRIMVATDVAARGLDISHVQHVINYDLPQCPEDYIHRIGRTARAGASGSAVCYITPSDKRKWSLIEQILNPGKASTVEKGFFEKGSSGRGRSDRPSSGGRGRSDRPASGGRPQRSFSDRSSSEERPQRSFSDRPSSEERPKRSFSDRPSSEGRPQRSFSDRPSSEGRPQRSFSDRPSSEGRPQRSFSDRPSSEARPQRSFSDRPSSEGRPQRSFSDRPSSEGRPQRSFSDRPSSEGRPQRSFSDRAPSTGRPRSERAPSGNPPSGGNRPPAGGFRKGKKSF